MKKIFALLSVLSILSIPAFSAEEAVVTSLEAESAEVKNAEENTRALNDFKDFSHWSLSLNVGMSQFDGDVKQNFDQILSASKVSWTIGLEAEYTWNPVWGLLLNFQYMPYQGVTGSTDWGRNSFKGNMYAPSLMASVNMFNLFGQYRKSAAWNLYLNAGVGLIWYECVSTPVEGSAPGLNTPKGIGQDGSGYGTSISIPLGLNVEYNINKYLAVGLGAYYRVTNKDNFEGEHYTKGTMNDGQFYVNANLRVKFLQEGREGGHMRNISMYEYRQLVSGEKGLVQDIDSLKKRVKALEDTVANNILPRIQALEDYNAVTPDDDNDGVANFRDREPNTPKGAFVNYWGESIPQEAISCCDEVKQVFSALGIDPSVNYDESVYYAFDKSSLDAKAKKNIEKVVAKLNADPELKVEIRGYCDFPGSNDYNLKLSQRRVEAVKAALVKAGIEESRITTQPQGKLPNPPKAEQKNRRCDFFFSK